LAWSNTLAYFAAAAAKEKKMFYKIDNNKRHPTIFLLLERHAGKWSLAIQVKAEIKIPLPESLERMQ
jgi:hypothetical protein